MVYGKAILEITYSVPPNRHAAVFVVYLEIVNRKRVWEGSGYVYICHVAAADQYDLFAE